MNLHMCLNFPCWFVVMYKLYRPASLVWIMSILNLLLKHVLNMLIVSSRCWVMPAMSETDCLTYCLPRAKSPFIWGLDRGWCLCGPGCGRVLGGTLVEVGTVARLAQWFHLQCQGREHEGSECTAKEVGWCVGSCKKGGTGCRGVLLPSPIAHVAQWR